jgi:hypothetical protein
MTAQEVRHFRLADVLVMASADYSFLGSLTHTSSHGRYSDPWRVHKELKK